MKLYRVHVYVIKSRKSQSDISASGINVGCKSVVPNIHLNKVTSGSEEIREELTLCTNSVFIIFNSHLRAGDVGAACEAKPHPQCIDSLSGKKQNFCIF